MTRTVTPMQPTSVDLLALAECVERFSSKTVVLLGDFVADEFQFGDISRVSREAPVLILRYRETQVVPGGGANAANNLTALGARTIPITAVGQDASGDALLEYFRGKGADVSGIIRVKGWTTPTKCPPWCNSKAASPGVTQVASCCWGYRSPTIGLTTPPNS